MKHWRGVLVGLVAAFLVWVSLSYAFEGRPFLVGLVVLPFVLAGCFMVWGLLIWLLYPRYRSLK